MANWSKRRSTKAGNQGQRITRTINSSGKSTYSSSKRVGNTRTTTSISSSGKTKIYTTEHHPVLGVRRTVTTVNKTHKQKQSRPTRRRRRSNYDGPVSQAEANFGTGMVILLGALTLFAIFGIYLLIPLAVWVFYKVTKWWWNLIDEVAAEQDTDESPILASVDEPKSST